MFPYKLIYKTEYYFGERPTTIVLDQGKTNPIGS